MMMYSTVQCRVNEENIQAASKYIQQHLMNS